MPVERHVKHDLLDICADCFTLILQMRRTSDYGDKDVLRQRVLELLNKVEREAKNAGIAVEDIQAAIFALVAFLDETIIASEWSQKEAWLAKPLQLELYNRFDAGEEFFLRLDKLRQGPQYNSDLLELYYLCITLGFKGKYQFQGRDILRKIIEETYIDLRRIKRKSTEILSPHGDRKDEIVKAMAKEMPIWVVIVIVLSLGFFFYLIMTFLITGAAESVVRTIKNII